MKWSYSSISPTMTKVAGRPGGAGASAGFSKVLGALRPDSGSRMADLKLGAYGSTTPGSYTTSKAPTPVGSVISGPAFAPEFLSNAVNDLNEGQQLQSAMHADWRNSLLSAIQKGDNSLVPALTAASLSPGAKFSYGFGGTGGMTGGQPSQPSYWEQKLAMKDLNAATGQIEDAQDKSNLLGVGLGSLMYPREVQQEQDNFKKQADQAKVQASLARRVLGVNTQREGRSVAAWDQSNTWNRRKTSPNGWW
jgi:hypothetical protein